MLACVFGILHSQPMANVAESIRAYAAGFSLPQSRVFVVARTLREQDPTLLLRDPVGRNLSTHIQPSHIINLLIGTAVGDPIANVAALVRAYRAAGWHQPPEELFDGVEPQAPILGGQNLGLDLDGLINFLARPSAREREMRLRYSKDFRVTLVVGEALIATVAAPVKKAKVVQVDQYDAKGSHTPAGGQTFLFQGKKREVVPLRRWVHLEFAHFELAAELWADSLKHGAVYTPSLLDSADDEPENENASSLAGEPAPSDCQSFAHATDDSNMHTQTNGVNNRGSNPGVCVSSSGKSVRAGSATPTRRRHNAFAPHHHASA
jgi:hypothetical protein